MQKSKFRIQNLMGFTLIELLVVIAIIGILIGISLVALQGARGAGRDARRKADLEQIRSALEVYRSDCNSYPGSVSFGGALSATCPTASTYLGSVPNDPLNPTMRYYYGPGTGNRTYELCAKLESGGTTGICGTNSCGAQTCNYKVTSP